MTQFLDGSFYAFSIGMSKSTYMIVVYIRYSLWFMMISFLNFKWNYMQYIFYYI